MKRFRYVIYEADRRDPDDTGTEVERINGTADEIKRVVDARTNADRLTWAVRADHENARTAR